MGKKRWGWSVLLLLLLVLSAGAGEVPERRVKAYESAMARAEMKVRAFERAVREGDLSAIRKAALEIQADPAAVKALNRRGLATRTHFVETTREIKAETIQNLKERVAREFHVDPEAVDIETFTNADPHTIKAGHDWDVTVTINGKEKDYRQVKSAVESAYFDAAGGRDAYPSETPETFAKRHNLEVTSSLHAEAYEGGGDYLEHPESFRPKDPERLARTMEYKSHLEADKARAHAEASALAKREVAVHEQARQYTKQFDKQIKKIVKARHGRIPKVVQEGTKILRRIGRTDPKTGRVYTPADAETDLARLGKHGETIESIIQEGTTLAESAHKMKGPDAITRLKEKLGAARQKEVEAFRRGDQKALKKVRRKIRRTQRELSRAQQRGVSEAPEVKKPPAPSSPEIPEGAVARHIETETGHVRGGKTHILEAAQQGVDIFNSAQDITESLQGKKRWSETGEHLLDIPSGGAVSTVHQTVVKNRDFQETVRWREAAQKRENEHAIQRIGLRLRKSGVSRERTREIMEAMQTGNKRPLYRELNRLRKSGVVIPLERPRQVSLPGPDDTVSDRVKALGEGIVDSGKRAAGFVVQTGRNLNEMEGTVEEVTRLSGQTADKQREWGSQTEAMRRKLIASGIRPALVQSALERYRRGHPSSLNRLIRIYREGKIQSEAEDGDRKLTQPSEKEKRIFIERSGQTILPESDGMASEDAKKLGAGIVDSRKRNIGIVVQAVKKRGEIASSPAERERKNRDNSLDKKKQHMDVDLSEWVGTYRYVQKLRGTFFGGRIHSQIPYLFKVSQKKGHLECKIYNENSGESGGTFIGKLSGKEEAIFWGLLFPWDTKNEYHLQVNAHVQKKGKVARVNLILTGTDNRKKHLQFTIEKIRSY